MINPKELRINCRELRIGNWYHDSQRNRDFVVQEIRSMCIEHGDDDYSPTRIDQIDGIPLTSEWLERIDWAGYKDFYFNSSFCIDEYGHLYYRSDYTGINVVYVHQLQNIYFALTGSELQLKDKTV